jgi:hypothetical protein
VRYPLAALLALRERVERFRAAERREAARALEEARLLRAARAAEVRDEEAAGGADLAAGPEAWNWQAAARFAARRRAARAEAGARLAQAEGWVSSAERALARCGEALAAAVRERAALSRHREDWRAGLRRAREEAEEGEAEDVRAGKGP